MKQSPTYCDNGLIAVCAWCYPGTSVLLDYPWVDESKLTHGICDECLAKIISQAKSQTQKKD